MRRAGQSFREAALRTGAQRLRPVLLTSMTTALRLIPIVLGMNLDFATREIAFCAPYTAFWIELFTSIVRINVLVNIPYIRMEERVLSITARYDERHGLTRHGT